MDAQHVYELYTYCRVQCIAHLPSLAACSNLQIKHAVDLNPMHAVQNL
jgi:hypothetical protein